MEQRNFVLILATLAFVGCADRSLEKTETTDAGEIATWDGTYDTCVVGTWSGTVGSGDGYGLTPASATVTTSGGHVVARYVDFESNTRTFTFTPASAASATLSTVGQTVPGADGACAPTPDMPGATYPTTFEETSGTLTRDAGALYMVVRGDRSAKSGSCGDSADLGSSLIWVTCQPPAGATPVSTSPTGAAIPALGSYKCDSLLETFYVDAQGQKQVDLNDGIGALTLTQTEGAIVASYTADAVVSGSLSLSADSSSTALGTAGQQLMAPCAPFLELDPPPSSALATLPVASSSLTVVGTTATLTFSGTMGADSTCSGVVVVGTLICTR